MSRPSLNRPKSSAGLPLRCTESSMGQSRQDSNLLPTVAAAPSTIHRLPAVSGGAGPRLSRRPVRLWQPEPSGPRAVIGQGAFGLVFRATFMGRPAAVKEVGRSFRSSAQDYRREIRGAEFLIGLRHKNVVRYLQFDTESDPDRIYVVMELVEGRNLMELRRLGPFSEADTRLVIAQTCCGLHYLHSQRPPIVHRDVKGSNIMLASGLVKLVDLGLAILCDECDRTRRSLAGTCRFLAPEVFERQAYSPKSDVFALGCAVFELSHGRPPHSDRTNDMAVCYAVTYLPMPDLPGVAASLANLYSSCTEKDPAMRPTAAQILEHSFLEGT